MSVILGITGGIGSGKSYISALLYNQLGVPVYDCDAAAKRLNVEDTEIRSALTELVGKEVYTADRVLDRRVLADYLFGCAEHQLQVNNIIHPAVKRDFKAWVLHQSTDVVALESAILYESGFDKEVDSVLMVVAPLDVRVFRAMQRDNASREKILERIALQQTDKYVEKVDFIIENDTLSDSEILVALRNIIKSLTNRK